MRSTSWPTGSARLTSPVQVSARRPFERICSAVLSTSRHPTLFSSSGYVAGSRPVPVTTTSAPCAASARAVARPIPRRRPAPVTSATLPSSDPMPGILRSARSPRVLVDIAELLISRLDARLHALGARRRAIGAQRLPVRDRQHVVLECGLDGPAMPLGVHGLVHRGLGQLERKGILQRD